MNWTVEVWICKAGTHDFALRVSADFMAKVKLATEEKKYDQGRVKKALVDIARNSGCVSPELGLELFFGEYGIHQFTHPDGNGCWLSLDSTVWKNGDMFYKTHNCDTSSQQSLLMAMWMMWADGVMAQ